MDLYKTLNIKCIVYKEDLYTTLFAYFIQLVKNKYQIKKHI